MRGKSNVIKRNVEKVWGARYLPKSTVNTIEVIVFLLTLVDDESLGVQTERKNKSAYLNQSNFGT
jgi:hypothetical protein